MRLIDGEKFAAVLQDLADKHAEGGKTDVAEILLSVKGMLERQETVEAEPVVHGRWIYHADDLFPAESTQECSNCHEEELLTLRNENCCPNCGAKMDLE